jgi:hypothetical protein
MLVMALQLGIAAWRHTEESLLQDHKPAVAEQFTELETPQQVAFLYSDRPV